MVLYFVWYPSDVEKCFHRGSPINFSHKNYAPDDGGDNPEIRPIPASPGEPELFSSPSPHLPNIPVTYPFFLANFGMVISDSRKGVSLLPLI